MEAQTVALAGDEAGGHTAGRGSEPLVAACKRSGDARPCRRSSGSARGWDAKPLVAAGALRDTASDVAGGKNTVRSPWSGVEWRRCGLRKHLPGEGMTEGRYPSRWQGCALGSAQLSVRER
jgi:hypothetical protein